MTDFLNKSSLAYRIDKICDAFEDQWRTSQRPVIEEFLGKSDEEERPRLLRELLILEWELCSEAGEQLTLDDCLARFPGQEELLQDVFAEVLRPRQVRAFHVRCPHCRSPIEMVDDTPFDDITCPSCHSSFNLVNDGTAPYDAEANSVLGHFQLVRRLGTGAFGTVWKARDTELDRTVAVKVPRRGQLSPEETEKFLREARAAAQLKHPNIVSVHEVGREDDIVYIVSDLVDGLTLTDWLTGQRSTPREAAALCIKIAEALHHAHEQGVIHRDLKPGNIMLDRDGEPHIMDFGLAKREAGEITMTMDGQVLGTPAYMSPEQAKGEGHDADARSDVYSLGVILFELLTGERPFRGNTQMLLHQLLTEEAPSPRQFEATVPKDIETICLKCLEKVREKRYATAADFAADLRRHLNSEPITARPIGGLERGWRWVRRHPTWAGMATAVVVALLALVGLGIGMAYQERLETTNTDLNTAKDNLTRSLDRETTLSGELRTSLAETQQALDAEANAKAALDQLLYIRRVNLALAEWGYNDPVTARKLLEECPAQRRGWEWHYAHRVCHPELLIFDGHTSGVMCVAFSPNGQRIASGSLDETVKVWDPTTGEETVTIQGHSGSVYSVAFSPDGQHIASSSVQAVSVWDALTGQRTLKLLGHTDIVLCVAFSPDGKSIASASRDKTVIIWDATSGEQTLTIQGHTSAVFAVAFSPDGKRIVSGSGDKTVKIWDAATGEEEWTLQGHTGGVTCLAFSPDGKRIASGSMDKTVKIWDATKGEEIPIRTLQGHTHFVHSVAFSPNGQRIASISRDKTVKIWDAATGAEIRTLHGHSNQCRGLALSPDGQRIASASHDKTVRIWDATMGQEIVTLGGYKTVKIQGVIPASGESTHHAHTSGAGGVAFSSDLAHIASAGRDKTVKVWDSATGEAGLTLKGHTGRVNSAAFSLSGERIVSGSDDNTVRVWDAATGEERLKVQHSSSVRSVTFSPNGKRLASAGFDKTIKVWDADTGQEELTLRGHTEAVNHVAFSPDGARIVSGSNDKTVKVWSATTGEVILTLLGHTGNIENVVFSPDGQRLASTSADMTIRVWDANTGQEQLTIRAHDGLSHGVVFSPNGQRLASIGREKMIKIWDANTGDVTLTLYGHTERIITVAFSSDGKRIVSAAFDGTVRTWDARSGQWPDDKAAN